MQAPLRVAFFIGDLIFLNLSVFYSYIFLNIDLAGVELVNCIYLLIFSNLAWLFLIIVSNPYSIFRGWGFVKILLNQLSFLFIHLVVVAFENLLWGCGNKVFH